MQRFHLDSSDLYDFHLFLLPMFPSSIRLSALRFIPLLLFFCLFSLIFSIPAPEHASFSPRHVLPLTKPLVMLQKKSRLFHEICSRISFPSGLLLHRCEVLHHSNHAFIHSSHTWSETLPVSPLLSPCSISKRCRTAAPERLLVKQSFMFLGLVCSSSPESDVETPVSLCRNFQKVSFNITDH